MSNDKTRAEILRSEDEAFDRAYDSADVDIEDLYKKYKRLRTSVRYAQTLLAEFDNYGSDDLDVMVRELKMRLHESHTRVSEVQARCTEIENERRGWKARAESAVKLLTATLVEMRIHGGPREQTAAEMVKSVAARADALEADAWCKAAAEARAFVKACDGQFDEDTDSHPLGAFIREWFDRFKRALG